MELTNLEAFILGVIMLVLVGVALMVMAVITDESVCNDRCKRLDEPEDKLIIKLFSEEGLDDEEINFDSPSCRASRWGDRK